MIVENLAARATWSGIPHSPKIVTHTDPGKPFFGYTDLIQPNTSRLVILLENSDPELVLRQSKIFSQQFPGITDGLTLEVVTKTKITEHLEKGMVPCCVTNVF